MQHVLVHLPPAQSSDLHVLTSHLKGECGAAGNCTSGRSNQEGFYVADVLLFEDLPVGFTQSVVCTVVGCSVWDYSDDTGGETSIQLW